MQKAKILECTLRDGSYAINFQFTEDDTRNISKALEDVGFDLIEVGHGLGLRASEVGKGVAAETDETYLKAAAESMKKAMWGMFCIPGIAKLEDVDKAAEYGMKFIRIGTNIEDYKESEPFIKKAKKHDMLVCSNFMKSYVSLPKKFAEYAAIVNTYGSDIVYLVDSAGGMFPDDIEAYARAVQEKCPDIKLGFHGHHNIGMGVANSIKAVETGFEIVDTSLQGLGRSAGNAPTEQVLCAMMRMGIDLNIDPIAVMDIGEKYIHPILPSKGLSSVDVVSGLALFHSSYMKIIEKYATEYRIDPRRLIVAVCEQNRTEAPHDLVKVVSKKLSEEHVNGSWKPLYQHYYGEEQS